jgi:hypothetical protein
MKYLSISLLIVIIFFSCGSRDSSKHSSESVVLEEPSSTSAQIPDKVQNYSERKIVKEGELRFECTDVSITKSLIDRSVKELNGYISKDEVFDYSEKLEHQLIIRVPNDKFDELLSKIIEAAKKIDSKNINVLDVTEEFIDIEARIKTKKELEERYKSILRQALKVEEILTIEKELGKLREDIESVEGRLHFLKNRISLSTLTVTYYQKTHSAFGFTSKIGQAIKGGWNSFLWFLIGLTHFWVFILISIVCIYIFRRIKRNRKRNKI